MLLSPVPFPATLDVQIIWDDHFLQPLQRYRGVSGSPRPEHVSQEDADHAWEEWRALESELLTLIHAFYERTGSLPVVGDELCVRTIYHHIPNLIQITRRIHFMPNEDGEMAVVYALDSNEMKGYL